MKLIPDRIRNIVEQYVVHKGNFENFLRSRGVKIGENCQLLNRIENYGTEPWLIEIGNKVTVTYGVFFINHDGSSRLFRKNLSKSSIYGNKFGAIRILDNCFIGINSIILPGVTIGPNSIVGAGSVVHKDIKPNMVVAGVPAKEISNLDDFIVKYTQKMIPISATNRKELRKELTFYFWGEER